jgi:hypothetical protein
MFGSIATMGFVCRDYDYSLYCFGKKSVRREIENDASLQLSNRSSSDARDRLVSEPIETSLSPAPL